MQTFAQAAEKSPGTCSSWSVRTGWLIKARTWCTCGIWNRKEGVSSRTAHAEECSIALHISKLPPPLHISTLHISKCIGEKYLIWCRISKHCNSQRWIIFEGSSSVGLLYKLKMSTLFLRVSAFPALLLIKVNILIKDQNVKNALSKEMTFACGQLVAVFFRHTQC